ncbi:MAG: Ig-like domain-containing protein [Candidatus Edwardsbacteria bacterium]|nr:Ig-like domain-containing protein [Candidatus Edwardsbacteria bacterium]MBU1576951.1 Ig-like domain-containing protein [Candidatus Edwardsbacteria bacterium]MBU2463317.1 Ig-like domain-containing protein [Candidatus Edwardsbacteria bacterium]MBU2593734.1 Ig-like domain-containing protein [Candidatus Edwardsbacteria bacterium]
MKKTSLFILATLAITAISALGQVHGDCRSAVSGNWGVFGTWATYDTVSTSWIPATVVPTSANNVTIRTGDSVMVEASGKNCLNLIIETNAKLYTNSTSNRYLNIYGSTLINDGVMGGGIAGDGISINFGYTNDLVIQGAGSTDISRIRPNGSGNYGITFDQDVNLHFVGAALYSNGKVNTTYTINAGKTLSFGPGSFFAYGTNGATATSGMGDAVVNIDGNMIMYNGSNFNVSVTTGNTSTVNISGMLSAGDSIMANGTGSEVFNINTGGRLLFPNTDTLTFLDSLNFNNIAGFAFNYPLTIAGKLGLMSGVIDSAHNIKMLDNSTIQRTAGLLTEPPVFMNSVNLIYIYAYPCTTGYEMPTTDIVQKLTINNPAGMTIDETVNVNDTLFLIDGIVNVTGSNMLEAVEVARSSGYVIGTLGRLIEAGANINKAYDIGTVSGYSPVSVDFNNVTKQGLLSVSTYTSTAPGVSVPENCMSRYWELGMRPDSLVEFDYYDLTLNYLSFDFNTGFIESTDEPSMVAARYDSAWTFPVIGTRNPGGVSDGGSVVLDSLTAFDFFTLAKDQDAIYSAGDTIAPYIVSTSPADEATEVALDAAIYIAFSEPMDTLSLAGSMTPSPNEEPAWNATMDTLFLVHDPMISNTSYTVRITSLTDMAGNPLTVLPDSFMFTTIVGDTIAPYITGISPAWNAMDVGINEPIVIVFSETMDTSSVNGYTSPDAGNMVLTWNATLDTVTVTPDNPYTYGTTYSLIMTAGTDTAGNSLAFLPDTVVSFTSIPTGVEGRPEVRAYVLQLQSAAPNPMTSGTTIRFSLPASAQVSLEVFNVLGQKVTTLANGKLAAGYHTINWNGTDRNGAKLASGVYIYQLRTMDKTLTKRMTILR